MRKLPALLLLLPLAATADQSAATPDAPASREPVIADDTEIVVTASRRAQDVLVTPASISRIDGDELEALSAKHQADVLNRNAGVYIQHGSGAESLGAIRSPVLAGAGACGAFLVAEDTVPIRPVGFCNLNEMFELNYEQAGSIEVLRGPGSAVYGASAVHGIVNLLTPRVADLPAFSVGAETGADSFKRIRFGVAHPAGDWDLGAYGTATRAPGWRAASGVDEAKLNLLGDATIGGGTLRIRAAGTVLNQETAGFIQGFDAYRDAALARSNPNPEAFRDASSARVSAHYEHELCDSGDCSVSLAGMYRRSRMDFLQHFLIGKPFEHNAQTSYFVSGTLASSFLDARMHARLTVDAELADSELTELQPGPATDGAPAANAIRPAGLHYDYTVDSNTVGATLALDYDFAARWSMSAAVRTDRTRYDYDNLMIDGNTRADGTPRVPACLYSRPADRADTFDNLTPLLTLSWHPGADSLLYLTGSSGFRPPEMAELYRLQRQQSVADLHSEAMESLEAGWKLRRPGFSFKAAAYAMNKKHLILREANGFNVSDGRTKHRGVEYEARWLPVDWLTLRAAGTYARHEYAFSRSIEGGETIVDGNDVDTAPRHLHNLGLDLRLAGSVDAGIDVMYVGSYWLDAANTASYPGHRVANLRLQWRPDPALVAALRVDNVFDTAYADRADFAFGNYRYFPARGRALFLSLDYRSE
jgi:iron complex outermembrane receptor protein